MQKGDMKKGGEAGEVAKDMKVSDVKDFAKTKHKGLPAKKKSEGYADDQREKTKRQLAAHDKAMIKSAKKSIEKYEKNKNKNEEAAGVGIVTKQNATADVPVGGEYMNVKKLFPKNKKKKTKEDNVQELVVKQQRPKIDVINNIAMRKDNNPFPLSYKDTGGASSGGMVYITPENAKKFIQFYDRRAEDEQQLMLQALKSVSGLKNLFNNLGLEVAKIEATKEEQYTREQLPQIKNKHLDKIRHTVETIEIGDIIPVQEQFIFENFKKQIDSLTEGNYKPIIVDCNNKIINGHHRYAALQMLGETDVKVAKLFLTVNAVVENFADGKKKGKSRPGRVKKSGASCNGSVSELRKKAKNAGGEKGRMYHWCANMKSGRKKGK
jgi:hypothetical protein